jgi:hypothetical protein
LETNTGLAKKHDFILGVTRSAAQEYALQALRMSYVNGASDILNELCQFFIDHGSRLESMTCRATLAPQTGGTMLNRLTVTLPAGTANQLVARSVLGLSTPLSLDSLIHGALEPSKEPRVTVERQAKASLPTFGRKPRRSTGVATRTAVNRRIIASTQDSTPGCATPKARLFATTTRRFKRRILKCSVFLATTKARNFKLKRFR